jgi:hypothetical protein
MLTAQNFLDYSGYTSTSNLNFLDYVLDSLDQIIRDETNLLFGITQVTDFDVYGANMDILKIGAWQTITSVYRGSNGISGLTQQTLNQDYRLIRYKETPLVSNNPIVALKLISTLPLNIINNNYYASNRNFVTNKLYPDSFLRISGTYGWGSDYPADLTNLLYTLIKARLEYNTTMTKTGGNGMIEMEKSLSRQRKLLITPELLKQRDNLAKNIMSDLEVVKLITKYKRYTSKNIIVS